MSALLAAFDPQAFRWGSSTAPLSETVVIACVALAMTIACALVVRHQRRRQARSARRVANHWQALSAMGDLCPRGWQAQITVDRSGAPAAADAPPSRVPLVELEWRRFDERSGSVALARRVWAPTIGGALQAMVDDRLTDIILEQIEQASAQDQGSR
jgi:hypothetical protein